MNKCNFDKLGYYQLLNVSQDASEEDIRLNYKELVKFWHPDHNQDPQAVDMFQKISVAYDVLKDTNARLKYNLLSIIYNEDNFPDMNVLALIRNMHGQEDINLRAFHLIEITGKGLSYNSIDKIYYCNSAEAVEVIKNITKHNWTQGFWGVTALFANVKAIIYNITHINNKKDNLLLLIHNSLVYKEENKISEAATLAILAKNYASKEEMVYINQYLKQFIDVSPLNLRKWNFSKFIRQQLFYPVLIITCLLVVLGLTHLGDIKKKILKPNIVKEVVVFSNGQKVFSDVAVAKIFDIPVDVYDTKRLYHVTQDTASMHGADKSFDVFKMVKEGTTVRITGYTVDKMWLRVMFDDGEMAFIEADKLAPGIGNEIPLWSKIYKEK